MVFLLAALAATASAAPATSGGAPTPPEAGDTDPYGPAFLEQVHKDTEWLSSFATRIPGWPEHNQALKELLEKVRAVPGVRVWTHEFPVYVPLTRKAQLTVTTWPWKGEHKVYPVWPALVRTSSTPAEGITGRLIHLGKGKAENFPARSLQGQIAVLEMAGSETAWMTAANLGASAVILLGSEKEDFFDARAHLLPIPVNVPRFYIPEGPLAQSMRDQKIREGTLQASVEWVETPATNIYALVKRPNMDKPRRALALTVQWDSMGITPDLAPGADAAVDAATALNALRHYAKDPPTVPVIVSFLDAYSLHQRGIREMMGVYSVTPKDRSEYVDENEKLVKKYRESLALADELEASKDPTGRLHLTKHYELFRCIKDEIGREKIPIQAGLERVRLALARATTDAEKATRSARLEQLKASESELNAAQSHLLRGITVSASARARAGILWQQTRVRLADQLKETEARLATDDYRNQLRLEMLDALGFKGEEDHPLSFMVGMDLSDAGIAAGPSVYCRYLLSAEVWNVMDFSQWTTTNQSDDRTRIWNSRQEKAVDLSPFLGQESLDASFAGENANLGGPAESFSLPAVTWTTLTGLRTKVDTVRDRADLLDWERLDPQIEATLVMLDRLAADTTFSPDPRVPWWGRVLGSVVDQASGDPLPRLPVKGALTTLVNGSVTGGQAGTLGVPWGVPIVPGIRRHEFTRTGSDGKFCFDLLPLQQGTTAFFVQSYLLAPDGRIARAVNMNAPTTNLNTSLTSRTPSPPRAAMFDCDELQLFDLMDPRYITSVGGTLLEARLLSPPKRLNLNLFGSTLSALIEPETRYELITRIGLSRNALSLSLLNFRPEGAAPDTGLPPLLPKDAYGSIRDNLRGFSPDKPLPSCLTHLSALDFYNLDQVRLADYRRAGIISQPIDQLRERTRALLEEAQDALKRDDGAALFRAAGGALSNEARAYQAVRDMADDVIHGAVLLLIALVPFAFVLERLLIGTPRIYHQIGATAAIFAIMTAILWSFHPAFRISSQPLTIILAFGIIFLSSLVISMLYSKFETELEALRSGRAEASGARTSRLGVLVTAVQLGIANMRKRKLRTALTGLTVVLITFALLCFISVSTYVGHHQFGLGFSAPFTGVVIRSPSRRPLSEGVISLLENVDGQKRMVVPRRWWANADMRWQIYVRSLDTGKRLPLSAGLGLDPAEVRLTHIDRVLPNWDRFVKEGGCYLAKETAESLGVRPGQKVTVAGRDLELLGAFDPIRFDKEIRCMDGDSILPFDFAAIGDDQRGLLTRDDPQIIAVEMEKGIGLESDKSLPFLSSSNVIFLPADLVKRVRFTSLRSVAIPTATAAEAEALAMEIAKRLAYPVYYGSPEGTRVVATMPLMPKAPKSLIIPLVIGGFIIFNTMLSSIAERKKEIYIYTSLGLAPVHVGALFLAEATTYGLMGSIFGYIVGQGMATAFSHFGWMGGLTLNYSGTQAIATMVLVLVVVILSSLVPAFMAGKLAMPSNKMTWSVPKPEGDVIRDVLPFTVTGQTANGVVAFLFEYFDAHKEGSVGRFATDNLRMVRSKRDGRDMLGIEATVWLAPYDMGVRQQVRLLVVQSDDPEIYEIRIELARGSGQVRSWWGLNRVFLGELRRQLLGWRQLKTERILAYIARAAEMKALAPATER